MVKEQDWENDKYVVSWLEGIVKKDDYKREFALFFDWLQQRHPELDTPTKLIEKRINDLRSDNPVDREFFESLVVSFKNHLEQKNLKEGTIRAYLRSVRSFFSRNRLPLQFKRKEMKVEESLEVRENHKPKWIIGNEEIRAVYSISRIEDRALLLTLYHTGLSPIDLCELKIENFTNTVGESRLYDKEGKWKAKEHVYLEKKREKTDVWQKTCLSEEAVHDVGLVLMKRGYPKEGYLLLTRKHQPLTVRYINERLKELVGLALGKKYGKEFQGSDLRDAYNDALLRSDLKQEIKDIMFGHERAGARGHYHVSEATIKEAYEKVFPYLSINSIRRSREDIARISTQQKELIDMLKELIRLEIRKELTKEDREGRDKYLEKLKEFQDRLEKLT